VIAERIRSSRVAPVEEPKIIAAEASQYRQTVRAASR
jgi:hypothetical protein